MPCMHHSRISCRLMFGTIQRHSDHDGRFRSLPNPLSAARSIGRFLCSWLLQEITTRLPGRIDSGVTSYGSVTDLVSALRRAEAAHGEHEKRTGVRDANWADWYAAYMAAEQTGAEL